MTLREALSGGMRRSELKAAVKRPCYAEEMYGLSYDVKTREVRAMLRAFARSARG